MNIQEVINNEEDLDAIETTLLMTALRIRQARVEIATCKEVLDNPFAVENMTDGERIAARAALIKEEQHLVDALSYLNAI